MLKYVLIEKNVQKKQIIYWQLIIIIIISPECKKCELKKRTKISKLRITIALLLDECMTFCRLPNWWRLFHRFFGNKLWCRGATLKLINNICGSGWWYSKMHIRDGGRDYYILEYISIIHIIHLLLATMKSF